LWFASNESSCELVFEVKLLLTSDLHLVHQWRENVLSQVAEWITKHRPDALVIAGDLSVAPKSINVLRDLRKIFPDGPIALTLGNHDFWLEPGSVCRSLPDVIDRWWRPAAKQFEVTLLDRDTLPLDEITLVGGYGHYDLGFRCPELRYDGTLVTRQDYLIGKPPTATPLRWRDFSRMPPDMDLAMVAQEQVHDLRARLRFVTEKRALLVVHTPPFAALLGIPDISTVNLESPSVYAFFRAYLGNEQMGAMIRQERERVIGVVCGHTHREVSPIDLGGFFGVNIGSDYGEPAGYLFETRTSRMTKISGSNGSSTAEKEKGMLSA
jgi:3',5'-cyclic AMP phosphodiesterase CpdA